jgi:AcrR family transcriptional regulator
VSVLGLAARPDRRAQILDAALTVFAEKGYYRAGVADIIAKTGVARGTFYLYFTSKRAVFDAVLDDIFGRILETIAAVQVPDPWDEEIVIAQVRANAQRLARMMLADPRGVRVLFAEAAGLDDEASHKIAEFYDRLGRWVSGALEDGVQLGIVRPCNTMVAAHALIGSLRGMLWAWAVGLVPLDEATMVDEALRLARDGVLTPRPPS